MEKRKAAKALMMAAALAGGGSLIDANIYAQGQTTVTKKYVWCQSKLMYRECNSLGNGDKCTQGQTC